jgi:hypothetical protein
MTPLTALWLPIIVSAVFVFIASAIVHMAPLWHKSDYPAPPQQDGVGDALRPFNIPPGDYLFPRAANRKEMTGPEYQEKIKRGPVMIMTVMKPGPFAMGATFVQWFIFIVLVSIFSAYVASRAVGPLQNHEYLDVFRFAGTTAFLAYSMAVWPLTIWYHRGAGLAVKDTIDGLIYALLTAGTFGWLWPR